MGGCCCCQRQEDFAYTAQGRERRCFCKCNCCCGGSRTPHSVWRCCGCMLGSFSHPQEEHDATSSIHSTSLSQSAGLLHISSTGASLPDTFHAPPRPLSFDNQLEVGAPKPQKDGGIPLCDNTLAKNIDSAEEKTDGGENKKSQICKPGKADVISILDDEDICPTCLEGYDDENPKVNTKCGHHFHLGCILEWQERSNSCPVCDKEMEIDESQ